MQASDLTLQLLEHLALESEPCGVTELAESMGLAKTTVHRHLRTLVARGFVRQHTASQRYEPDIKLLQLGERLRERFTLGRASREVMQRLRDASGQAVTLSSLIDERVVVVDLVQGHSLIEFGIRPGTEMSLVGTAHGRVALTFGPAALHTRELRARKPGSASAVLDRQLSAIRKQGWATAANEVVFGVNALAAPVFGTNGRYHGALAIVGSVQFIPARPSAEQIAQVTGAAEAISSHLGWRAH
jgi:DNA-binding IclR family transcriptional regulator